MTPQAQEVAEMRLAEDHGTRKRGETETGVQYIQHTYSIHTAYTIQCSVQHALAVYVVSTLHRTLTPGGPAEQVEYPRNRPGRHLFAVYYLGNPTGKCHSSGIKCTIPSIVQY